MLWEVSKDLACRAPRVRVVRGDGPAGLGLTAWRAVLDVGGTMAREAADEMFPQDMHICVRATDL
jgi:hypothetical protein